MQRFLNLFIFTDALHVSGGSSAHHQEHITVHKASGIVNHYPPETCTGSVNINKFKKRCIFLAIIWNYIMMH